MQASALVAEQAEELSSTQGAPKLAGSSASLPEMQINGQKYSSEELPAQTSAGQEPAISIAQESMQAEPSGESQIGPAIVAHSASTDALQDSLKQVDSTQDTSLVSASSKPVSQAVAAPAVKPLKQAKASGMRAMLGRKAAKAISTLLGPAPSSTPASDKVIYKDCS